MSKRKPCPRCGGFICHPSCHKDCPVVKEATPAGRILYDADSILASKQAKRHLASLAKNKRGQKNQSVTAVCGCINEIGGEIIYCSMHFAAPALAEELDQLIRTTWDTYRHRELTSQWEALGDGIRRANKVLKHAYKDGYNGA